MSSNCGIIMGDISNNIPRVAANNRGDGQPITEVNDGYSSTINKWGKWGCRIMGSIKFIPKNEMQTREWFAFHLREFDYSIVKSGRPFPDYVLENKEGILLDVEIEYRSSNFVTHRHDPNDCDMIVCWVHDLSMPLPVLELSTRKHYDAGAVANIQHRANKDKSLPRPSPDSQVNKIAGYAKLTPSIITMCNPEIIGFGEALVEHLSWFTESELAHRELVRKTKVDVIMRPYMELVKAIRRSGGGKVIDACGVMEPEALFSLVNGEKVPIK